MNPRAAFSPPQRGEGARSADEGSLLLGTQPNTPHPASGHLLPSHARGEGWGRGDYSDPYLAGVALGLVLLAAFAFAGRGLGASGAFTSVAANITTADSALFARYRDGDSWLLVEIVGVIIGGFLSALLARRFSFTLERGRLAYAFGGGALMGLGAVLARGCTSGLGLTGGALLSAGSWLFIAAAFAAGYAVAPFVRKAWQ